MTFSRPAPLRDTLLMHFVVFVWGFTAILGKLITLQALGLVWYRVSIALIGIFCYVIFRRMPLRLSFRDAVKLLGAGGIITAHWLCFFHAIKVSNASVTLACLSSGALFAALLEPIIFGRRVAFHEVACGVLAVCSLYLIFRFETHYAWGMIYSLAAAFLSALFSVINGRFVRRHKAEVISLYEMAGGLALLSLYLAWSGKLDTAFFNLSWPDGSYLLFLGLVCTAFAFVTSVKVLNTISPYTMLLTINLEPVYGIVMAYFIFGEDEKMTFGFYLGTALILATIFVNAAITGKAKAKLAGVETAAA